MTNKTDTCEKLKVKKLITSDYWEKQNSMDWWGWILEETKTKFCCVTKIFVFYFDV